MPTTTFATPMVLALFASLLAAVLPTVAYVMIFYWADRYEREPRWLLIVAFVWGSVPAIALSAVAEIALGNSIIANPLSLTGNLVAGAVIAPVVEEVVKGAALLWLFVRHRQEFDGVLDGLIYGALVGFGFAMTENFVYFIGAYASGGYTELTALIILRAIVFGLNHAFYTGLTGVALGAARHRLSPIARGFYFMAGLGAATLVHALHNLGAGLSEVTPNGLWLSLWIAGAGFGLILLTMGLAWQHERNLVQVELLDEIGTLLTPDEYARLTGRWRGPGRPHARARAQLLVELANRKRRMRVLGANREPELVEEMAQIRDTLGATYGTAV